MKHRITTFALVMTILLSVCVGVFAQEQPEIGARVKPIIEVDGLLFKDLNENGRLDPYEDWRLPAEERIEDLLSQMTLDEKIGTLMHSPVIPRAERAMLQEPGSPSQGPGFPADLPPEILEEMEKMFGDDAPRPPRMQAEELDEDELAEMLHESIVGSHVTWSIQRTAGAPTTFANYTNTIQEIAEGSRLGIPFVFCSDSTDGRAGFFNTLAAAATRNVELVQKLARQYALEMRAVGLHQTLQPQADLATEPRWSRAADTFGEDAYLAADMVRAFVLGYQGEELGVDGVITTLKHFPGSGPELGGYDAHFKRGRFLFYPSHNYEYHLIPFEAGIQAGAASVMPYYAIPTYFTTLGAHYSKDVMDILYDDLGFTGFVTSDFSFMEQHAWGLLEDGREMDGRNFDVVSVKERIDLAYNAGGLDLFGGMNYPDEVLELINENRISEEDINDSVRKILIPRFQMGLFDNPYADPDLAVEMVASEKTLLLEDQLAHESVVLLQNDGILPLPKNIKVFVSEFSEQAVSKYATIVEDLEEAQVAVISINFGPREEDLVVPAETVALVDVAVQAGVPVVAVINMNRTCIVQDIVDISSAALWQFVSGDVGDAAVTDVLFGEYNPVGKLPFEVPSSMQSVQYQREDLPYDSANPTWTFGYGLSF